MKKSLLQIHQQRLINLFYKLQSRLAKNFQTGRFSLLSKSQQQKLIRRIEKLKIQLSRFDKVLRYAGLSISIGAAVVGQDVMAQATSQGNEFKVNTYTSLSQYNTQVAMDDNGNYVITWQSSQDGVSFDYGIYAQRYNASGVAQGAEFRVNTYTSSNQVNPDIAMDRDGNFVITWQSYGQDGYGDGIYAQRFNASGVSQGAEFKVNTYTTSAQRKPHIAMDNLGDFTIVWESAQESTNYGIYGQRYNASGVAQGGEFHINTHTTNDQKNADIAMDSDGDFVVVWESDYQDGDYSGVYAQRYNAAGEAQGSEFRVNSYTTGYQFVPSVSMDSDGDFVIAWPGNSAGVTGYNISAQRYNAAGTAQGNQFIVNTNSTNSQNRSSVAMNQNGDFVITWQSYGQDGSSYGVFGQLFHADGTASGSEFRVNSYTTEAQKESNVAMDSNGDFVVAWASYSQDGDSYGVYAQRYSGGFPTSVLSKSNVAPLNMYPNPAKGETNVDLDGTAQAVITDLSGRVVKLMEGVTNRIDLTGIEKGIYLLEIIQGEKRMMNRLVVE